jgi:hypothetical protein
MNREIHVRLCERLGAKFPGPTRREDHVEVSHGQKFLLPSRDPVVASPALTLGTVAIAAAVSARPNERANLGLLECVLFVATIIRMTHPNSKRLKKDRGRCASRVANRLAESGAYPMSAALGTTSGNIELDAIQGSGVSLDRRARLLEYDVPTQVFSWKWGCIARY